MKAAIGCLVVGLIALLAAGAFAVPTYNRLVQLDETVDAAWAQVENVYQRRADLIPNLVETVKGARDFERETFTEVAEARSQVGAINFTEAPNAEQLEAFEQMQNRLSSAIARLLVVVERYPELQATQAFRDLQVQIEGTENRIAVERGRYNEVARDFNAARRTFPTVLIASLLGFDDKPYFESAPGAETPPAVDFGED